MSHFKWQCDHCVHRQLVLTPAGRPITHAASPLEVVTCLLDLVISRESVSYGENVMIADQKAAHKQIWLLGILHWDISINNTMMYEEILPDGTVRVWGLLIDFNYAIKVDGSSCTAGPRDRTVSPVGQNYLQDINLTHSNRVHFHLWPLSFSMLSMINTCNTLPLTISNHLSTSCVGSLHSTPVRKVSSMGTQPI